MFWSFVVLSFPAPAVYAAKFKLWISWDCLVQLFLLFFGPINSCSLFLFCFRRYRCIIIAVLNIFSFAVVFCCFESISNFQYQETQSVFISTQIISHLFNSSYGCILLPWILCAQCTVHIPYVLNVIEMKMKTTTTKFIFFCFVFYLFSSRQNKYNFFLHWAMATNIEST